MAFKVGSLAFINPQFFNLPDGQMPVHLERALEPSNVWGAMWLVRNEYDTQITVAESFLIPRRGRPKKIENLPKRLDVRIFDDVGRRA